MADLGGGGGSMGSVEPPFLTQSDPESPGNGVSDVPDFKIFSGEHASGPPSLSDHRRSQIRTLLGKILDPPQRAYSVVLLQL